MQRSLLLLQLLGAIDCVIPPNLFSVDKTGVIFTSQIKVCGRTMFINMLFYFICKKVGYMSIVVS